MDDGRDDDGHNELNPEYTVPRQFAQAWLYLVRSGGVLSIPLYLVQLEIARPSLAEKPKPNFNFRTAKLKLAPTFFQNEN